MIIRCLLFGEARALIGADSVVVEHPDVTISATDLLEVIIRTHPKLAKIATMLVLAVNCEYVPLNGCHPDGRPIAITERDEVALMPPISGG